MKMLSSIIFCSHVGKNNDGESIYGVLQSLIPINIPSNYSFWIVFTVENFDVSKNNTARVKFCSPNGEAMFESKDIPIQSDTEKNPKFRLNLELTNFPIWEPGMYCAYLYWNGEEILSKEIEAIKQN